MIMVIFGAGASYDSVPSRPPLPLHVRARDPARPPLAAELFQDGEIFRESIRQFPRCHPIVPYLQSVPHNKTLEHVLETLQAEGETDPERKCQLAAIRHFLQLMIGQCERHWNDVAQGRTNYVTLLDQLRRCRQSSRPVLLVTFNYDRMIENALMSVGIQISAMPHYTQHEAFKLFKLHGSVHWGREVETPVENLNDKSHSEIANELIAKAVDLKISDRYRMVVDGHPVVKIENVPLFPAIAIPVETKLSFECPNDHLECLREYLPNVTKILIVGWKATERHFLDLLKRNMAPSEVPVHTVVGGMAEAEEINHGLLSAGMPFRGKGYDGGFTEYVVKQEAERFFKS